MMSPYLFKLSLVFYGIYLPDALVDISAIDPDFSYILMGIKADPAVERVNLLDFSGSGYQCPPGIFAQPRPYGCGRLLSHP